MPTIKAREAKDNELEDCIQRAPKQRDREGTTLRELVSGRSLSTRLFSQSPLQVYHSPSGVRIAAFAKLSQPTSLGHEDKARMLMDISFAPPTRYDGDEG